MNYTSPGVINVKFSCGGVGTRKAGGEIKHHWAPPFPCGRDSKYIRYSSLKLTGHATAGARMPERAWKRWCVELAMLQPRQGSTAQPAQQQAAEACFSWIPMEPACPADGHKELFVHHFGMVIDIGV